MVSDDEKEDFLSAIQQRGFKEKDFELTEQRDPSSGPGIYTITGSVTIRCKLSGTEKTYNAGSASSWTAEFHDDLASGFYGAPSA